MTLALRDLRIATRVAAAALDPDRPLLAQIVVTRRCNLACGYCFESDRSSQPVPTEVLLARLDHLARLRTVFVTLNGGEPLLHPDVVELVRAIAQRGMTPMINSNGLLLTRELILALGAAGLYGLQISADSLEPSPTTSKALRRLRPKLELLAAHARFRVRVNTVLGAAPPDEAVAVVRAAMALGFDAQCSLRRDQGGETVALDDAHQAAFLEIRGLAGRLPPWLHDDFQLPLSQGQELSWSCRSGARYFHVDEHGIVHLCQPRAGWRARPLADFGPADIRANFRLPKPCAARCPHAYAHIGSRLDRWRGQG